MLDSSSSPVQSRACGCAARRPVMESPPPPPSGECCYPPRGQPAEVFLFSLSEPVQPTGSRRPTITVVGTLTRDPEVRYTPTGQAGVKFCIAVNRFYVNRNGEKIEQTDFFNVNAWRSVAVNVAESLTTGARVLVTGRLQSRNWETEDGAKRSTVEIEAEEVAASLRFATVAITKAARAGAADEAQDQGEEVPA